MFTSDTERLQHLRQKQKQDERNCRWCVHAVTDERVSRLWCRQFPPVIYRNALNEVVSGWPEVEFHQACGEFLHSPTLVRDYAMNRY